MAVAIYVKYFEAENFWGQLMNAELAFIMANNALPEVVPSCLIRLLELAAF